MRLIISFKKDVYELMVLHYESSLRCLKCMQRKIWHGSIVMVVDIAANMQVIFKFLVMGFLAGLHGVNRFAYTTTFC